MKRKNFNSLMGIYRDIVPVIAINESQVDKSDPKNIETGVSNLFLAGAGYDRNGNWTIRVKYPNGRGFSIQTNGNLKATHRLSKQDKKLVGLSDEEIQTIGREVTDYVEKHGSKKQKSQLKRYDMKENTKPGKLREGAEDSEVDYDLLQRMGFDTDAMGRVSSFEMAVEEYGIEPSEFIRAMSDPQFFGILDYILTQYGVYQDFEEREGEYGMEEEGLMREAAEGSWEDYLNFDDVMNQYMLTALWATNDESDESGGVPFDQNYTPDDINKEDWKVQEGEVRDFLDDAHASGDLQEWLMNSPWENDSIQAQSEQIGHYFWLSREGHGAGFFDYGGDEGKRLTDLAYKKYGEVPIWAQEDGTLAFDTTGYTFRRDRGDYKKK